MFRYSVSNSVSQPDFILLFLCMSYVTFVILSIVLFQEIVELDFLNFHINLSGAVIPYVFLYPISFIVLRVYGLDKVNSMIASMILASLLFVSMAKIIVAYSSNVTSVNTFLASSFKMYLAGFIGMPAGIYTSFLTITFLNRLGFSFNVLTLTLATITGEIVNTAIVFPIGFHGQYSLFELFNHIILDALIFKIIVGAVLSWLTVIVINLILQKKFS